MAGCNQEGERGVATPRWGLLVDPAVKKWWLLADGSWCGRDPSNPTESPHVVDDFGSSRPAVEAAGTLGACHLRFALGLMAHAAAVTAGRSREIVGPAMPRMDPALRAPRPPGPTRSIPG